MNTKDYNLRLKRDVNNSEQGFKGVMTHSIIDVELKFLADVFVKWSVTGI